jgi:TolB protein
LDELSIHVIGVDGSNDRRITPAGVSDGSPRWSPDGSQIMFHSVSLPDYGIALSRADGSERRQLTWGNDFDPDWGPAE